MVLTPDAVKRYYDWSGTFQDRQSFYEDRALDDLVAHAAFDEAQSIVEFGCGTGRFARRVLDLAPSARYEGFDISTTMLDIARPRLASTGERAHVHQLSPGTVRLPLPDHAADRFVSTYVLDLLPVGDIQIVVEEAHRILVPGGRLCLVSLTTGRSPIPRLISGVWSVIFRLRPQLVGGCRPIRLDASLTGPRWEILHARVVTSWGLASEVVVAQRAG